MSGGAELRQLLKFGNRPGLLLEITEVGVLARESGMRSRVAEFCGSLMMNQLVVGMESSAYVGHSSHSRRYLCLARKMLNFDFSVCLSTLLRLSSSLPQTRGE